MNMLGALPVLKQVVGAPGEVPGKWCKLMRTRKRLLLVVDGHRGCRDFLIV